MYTLNQLTIFHGHTSLTIEMTLIKIFKTLNSGSTAKF